MAVSMGAALVLLVGVFIGAYFIGKIIRKE
jgi:uncharacterized protein YneF (UPF0154 family)